MIGNMASIFLFFKKWKIVQKRRKKGEGIYISWYKCDKPVERVLGSCQKRKLKRKTACPNSLHKKPCCSKKLLRIVSCSVGIWNVSVSQWLTASPLQLFFEKCQTVFCISWDLPVAFPFSSVPWLCPGLLAINKSRETVWLLGRAKIWVGLPFSVLWIKKSLSLLI